MNLWLIFGRCKGRCQYSDTCTSLKLRVPLTHAISSQTKKQPWSFGDWDLHHHMGWGMSGFNLQPCRRVSLLSEIASIPFYLESHTAWRLFIKTAVANLNKCTLTQKAKELCFISGWRIIAPSYNTVNLDAQELRLYVAITLHESFENNAIACMGGCKTKWFKLW